MSVRACRGRGGFDLGGDSCHYTTAGRQEGPRLRVCGGLLSMIREIRAAAVGLVAAEDDHATIN